jgi:hypothetical protein
MVGAFLFFCALLELPTSSSNFQQLHPNTVFPVASFSLGPFWSYFIRESAGYD